MLKPYFSNYLEWGIMATDTKPQTNTLRFDSLKTQYVQQRETCVQMLLSKKILYILTHCKSLWIKETIKIEY